MKNYYLLFLFIAISLLLSGCFIDSSIKISENNELFLKNMVISIDSGEEIVEASIRHSFNLLGLNKDIAMKEYKPEKFSMEKYLLLEPKKENYRILTNIKTGDRVIIKSLGDNQYKFTWNLESRVQTFIKDEESKSANANKVFLVVRIKFPGKVDMANTSEIEDDTYIWRFTNSQLTKDLKITALYSVPVKNK